MGLNGTKRLVGWATPISPVTSACGQTKAQAATRIAERPKNEASTGASISVANAP